MRKYVKSNDGYALVIALLVITVVTVLGLGILTTTSSSKKLSEEESKDQTAYYIAEAGLNQKKEELKEIPNLYNEYIKNKDIKEMKEADIIKAFLKEIKNKPILNKETIYREDIFKRKNAEAKVIVTIPSETELKFTITSTGIIKSNDSTNEKKRTVQSVDSYKLAITEKPAEEEFGTSKYVVHALGDFKFGGGSIVGNLGFKQSEKDKPSIFPFSGTYGTFQGKSGKVYACATWDKTKDCLNPGIANGDLVFNDSELPKIPDFPKEKFISLDTITQPPNVTNIQQGLPTKGPIPSGSYRVTVNDLYNTSIDIGNNKVYFYFDQATFDYRLITIKGTGELTIIAENFNKSSGSFDFTQNNVSIYSKNNFIMSGGSKILNAKNLSIYSKDVKLTDGIYITSINSISLYIYNYFEMGGTLRFSSMDNKLYYKGNNEPKLTGNFKNSIYLDFLNAPLTIAQGNKISGNIILRNENNSNINKLVKINDGGSANTPLYLYAPKFNVLLDNGISFFGSIIGNDVNVVNANITYKQPPPNNGGSTGGSTGSGQIDSSLTPNSDGGSIEVNNP
ncbi:pilus assembly PilX N-terminal domain-containing protein [Kurthia gibsonii]|uniref:pilus assembly PilX N-terminal domain-containing protein n=1 Tax=Kurthia gibsonii TaxID=33946 RepID=UPI0031B720D7